MPSAVAWMPSSAGAFWAAGDLSADWFDPSTGLMIGGTKGRTEGNVLTLALPAFNDDLVGVVTPDVTDSKER